MPLSKGSKVGRGYATIDDDGVNYRDISATLSEMGFKMNHSSARNYVLRTMKKFVEAYAKHLEFQVSPQKIEDIARSPAFQGVMADILQTLEAERRSCNKVTQ